MSTYDSTRKRGAPLPILDFTTRTYTRGILAGMLGAGSLAFFFLGVDAVQGVPLRTPAALGSIFFTGETLPLGATIDPALVLGYTALHGAGFAAVGIVASILLESWTRAETRIGMIAALAVALFGAFQMFILGLAQWFGPMPIPGIGILEITVANGIAAVVMAGAMLWMRERPVR